MESGVSSSSHRSIFPECRKELLGSLRFLFPQLRRINEIFFF